MLIVDQEKKRERELLKKRERERNARWEVCKHI
jgi:hypothetical protein